MLHQNSRVPTAFALLLLGLVAPACSDTGGAADADAEGITLGQVQQASISPLPQEVRAGTSHTCIRRYDGRMACWGKGTQGQLGDGVTPPAWSQSYAQTNVAAFGPAMSAGTWLAAGSNRVCFRDKLKNVTCWGTSSGGWPGEVTGPTPAALPGVSNADDIVLSKSAANFGHATTACMREIGIVRCWGGNNFGLLANGVFDNLNHPAPVQLTALGLNVFEIVLGESHACARTGGAVQCWGNNASGQLGDGTTTSRAVVGPVIAGLTQVVQLAAGNAHTCALKSDGTIRCWCAGGLIGDGTTLQRTTPHQLVQFLAAVEIAAGGNHTCARMTDNTVQCWGFNNQGQLGTGTTAASLIPTTTGLSNVTQITLGDNHSCALDSASQVKCWGVNTYGQLGDGTLTTRTSPTLAINL